MSEPTEVVKPAKGYVKRQPGVLVIAGNDSPLNNLMRGKKKAPSFEARTDSTVG